MIINLTSAISNISLQVGDIAYYSPVSEMSSNNNQLAGYSMLPTGGMEITEIGPSYIKVAENITIPEESFLLFVKNNQVNTSSLKGYYASVRMSNDTINRAELYSLGSEVVKSSK